MRNHLVPELGRHVLVELRPGEVQAFLNAKAAAGLAPRTVAYFRNVLRQALGHAERTELVGRNVARLVRPPRIPRREVRPLDPDQARVFLGAIRGDRLEALYLIALACGLRQGEILGLTWGDLDLAAGTIRVRRALQRIEGAFAYVETKSTTSRRIVALPAIVRAALIAHRERAAAAGAGRHRLEDFSELVFTTTLGAPLDGINVTRRFQRIRATVGHSLLLMQMYRAPS
ncbi:MAG: site-specific integrase, partial [Candidatus Limnocylindrales bacterium]